MRPVSVVQQIGIKTDQLMKLEPDSEKFILLYDEIEDLQRQTDIDPRYFFYGGSIRGGKSIICLTILIVLALMFKKSKWVVVRESYNRLLATSVKSMEWIIGNNPDVYWKRSQNEYFCQFYNGSRIYFMGEGYASDPQGHKFLGFEANGFCLEQCEELQKQTFTYCQTRCGSWHGTEGPPPPALMLGNFNPNEGWSKEEIYIPWTQGELPQGYYFQEAIASDNPYNSKEQWENWKRLDPATYNRMVGGDWTIEVKNAFLYAFDDKKHTKPGLALMEGYDIGISFDFNVDPMTCCIYQTDGENFFYVVHAFNIPNSDTYELCQRIRPLIYNREHMVIVTGDATGHNRMSGLPGHINHYQIIQTELGLHTKQIRVPRGSNPRITDSRVICNSIVANFPDFKVDSSLKTFIQDLKYTVCGVDKNGSLTIQKTGMNPYLSKDNALIGHNLDNLRYAIHTSLHSWLKVPKS